MSSPLSLWERAGVRGATKARLFGASDNNLWHSRPRLCRIAKTAEGGCPTTIPPQIISQRETEPRTRRRRLGCILKWRIVICQLWWTDQRTHPTPFTPATQAQQGFTMTGRQTTRRDFFKRSLLAAAAGSAIPYFAWTPKAFANASANDRPRIGCIGVGGMGTVDAREHASFGDIVAVCDVDAQPCGARQVRSATSARARPTPMATIARCSIAKTSTW